MGMGGDVRGIGLENNIHLRNKFVQQTPKHSKGKAKKQRGTLKRKHACGCKW
jgi:hypothetical protein